MFFRHFPNNRVGNFCAVTQTCQMQLAHFAAAAHIVHQVIHVPFAANKSHAPPLGSTSSRATQPATAKICSVWRVVYLPSTTGVNRLDASSQKKVPKRLPRSNVPFLRSDFSS